ncbi:hypothetical protein F5X99DRAFT_384258 [Biscogniauxia marginata]|nr:hypothetical protein F5X99DRAFT_384258 [Biscogniauxia marginata]
MMDRQRHDAEEQDPDLANRRAESLSDQRYPDSQATPLSLPEEPTCPDPNELYNFANAPQIIARQPTPAGPSEGSRAAQPRNFTFVIQDPESGRTISDKPRPAPWSKKFLENIPKTSGDWDEQRELLGITNESGVLKIFDYLTSWNIRIYPEKTVRKRYQTLGDELEFMASGPAIEKGINPKKAEKLQSFFSLVFVAGLCVAAYVDNSIDFGKYLSQHYSFISGKPLKTIPANQLKRYQKAIKWLVKMVEEKWMQGAEFLAPEWIVHANAPLSMYETWMRNTSTSDPFQIDLPEEGINAALPLHIPVCIVFAFFGKLEYRAISEALHSKLFSDKQVHQFCSRYNARSLSKCLCPPFSPIREAQIANEKRGLKFILAEGELLQAIYNASRQANWDQSSQDGGQWERSSTNDDLKVMQIVHDRWAEVVEVHQTKAISDPSFHGLRPLRLRHGALWIENNQTTLLIPDTTAHHDFAWKAGMLIVPGDHAIQVKDHELTFLICNFNTS